MAILKIQTIQSAAMLLLLSSSVPSSFPSSSVMAFVSVSKNVAAATIRRNGSNNNYPLDHLGWSYIRSSLSPNGRNRIRIRRNAVESRELRFYNSAPPSVAPSRRDGNGSRSGEDASVSKGHNNKDQSAVSSEAARPYMGMNMDMNMNDVEMSIPFMVAEGTPTASAATASLYDALGLGLGLGSSSSRLSGGNDVNHNHYHMKQDSRLYSSNNNKNTDSIRQISNCNSTPLTGTGTGSVNSQPQNNIQIHLTEEENELFSLLTQVLQSEQMSSTLRVAGGWVRDKLLATDEFRRCPSAYSPTSTSTANANSDTLNGVERLTSKFKGPSMGRQGTKVIGGSSSNNTNKNNDSVTSLANDNDMPVDIDIALDDMLGREFADHLNAHLSTHGQQTVSVGMVLKNPEKSKHLETATMKVNKFWIDFVNLRAEEYTEDSRIPDLMRIGTAEEDAFRRDLTINALFYNINTRTVEDLTGRGFEDLRKGIIATPLPPLTTLLDDPLRVLRSVRFAARLRFRMDENLREAAMDQRVRAALAQKVAKERIGSEVDLMLRSQDPVGAMRLLVNLGLIGTVFPIRDIVVVSSSAPAEQTIPNKSGHLPKNMEDTIFERGLHLLSTTHDHLCDCKMKTPYWCEKKRATAAATNGVNELVLTDDEESRRRLWYASFLKPLMDHIQNNLDKSETKLASRRQGKKANRSVIMKLMVDELKRPLRDAEAVERIMKAADDFTGLIIGGGCDLSATAVLLGEIRVVYHGTDGESGSITCHMGPSSSKLVDSETEDDPVWLHAMEFRLLASKVLERVGSLWRAALILSLSEQLVAVEDEQLSYTIEGDVFEETAEERREGIIQKYDAFAASLLQLGLIGIWSQQPLIDGREMKVKGVLPNIPNGPIFREIMDEQASWMTTHPGGSKDALVSHLQRLYPEFT